MGGRTPVSLSPDQDALLRRRAARVSISVSLILIVIKIVGFLRTDSTGMLSSLIDSMLDGISGTATLIGISQAQRPPSRSYRFGRGKAEPLAALAQAAFLVGSALLLVIEVIRRTLNASTVYEEQTGIMILGVSSLLGVGLVLYQRQIVRRTGSIAVKADLQHYLGDIGVNLAAMIGLFLVIRTGQPFYDTAIAFIIAVILLISARSVANQALRYLLDRELGQEERDRIRALVLSHGKTRGLHDLRTRNSGTKRFIELHLELDGNLTLKQAHDITDEVERMLTAAFDDAEILIHQEPAGLNDQRLDTRIENAQDEEG